MSSSHLTGMRTALARTAVSRFKDLPKPVRLSAFVAQNANRRMDLDVEYDRDHGKRLVGFRGRAPFSLDLVARLYYFRWQIERLFKEWKSYANLHKFDTANEHAMAFLLANARRSDPVRDRKTGRLRTGLRVVGGRR